MDSLCNNKTYCKFLLQLLNNQENIDYEENISLLKINIYLTLLSLNNNNYCDDIYQKEYEVINIFLRKINNLKVKIQLKRKDIEIEKLINEIKEIYINNIKIINKYNKNSFLIEDIINSKNVSEITKLLDNMTKIKIKKNDNLLAYNFMRREISDIIFTSRYYIDNDKIYIIGKDRCLKLMVDEFFEIFDYLLDIDNYKDIYIESKYNEERISLIKSLINLINNSFDRDKISNKEIISIIMTYLILEDMNNLNNIDMSNFKINNIKITDLYSFANNKDNNIDNHAKWNKIVIPNEYLYDKFNILLQKGMYYYNDDKFTIEGIDNKVSDFKISITIDKILEFLKNVLSEFLSLCQI